MSKQLSQSKETKSSPGWIALSNDGKQFLESGHAGAFIPWGFNYDRDYKMRLLEDYWNDEWETVAQDFAEMRQLGANVVRIHLQLAKFMDDPQRPNRRSLEQLSRLVTLAEKNGLYLDLTGLACYRKTDVPAWFANLPEKERWMVQAQFWEAIAKCCAASPAVFCYDLMNEPAVPMGQREPGAWLAGELAGFSYGQFLSLDQGGRTRTEIARQWIATLTAAIHKHDRRHLITVGLLPFIGDDDRSGSGFMPDSIADELDFIAVHIYPRSGHFPEDLHTLSRFQVGKPLVIEEIFNMSCRADELQAFLHRSRVSANGWMGFYWGKSPVELETSKDLTDILMRDWLKVFEQARNETNSSANSH